MTEPTALDASAAAALVAAAAGSCPPDAPDWTAQVRARAFELLRLVPDVVGRAEVLAACRPVTGILAHVEESKGRGVITIHATMGTAKRGQEVVSGRPVEYVRTAWLNEPAGRALFEQARSLIGRHCRFGKWTEQVSAELKVSMVEWIEDLGAEPGASDIGANKIGTEVTPPARVANRDSRSTNHGPSPTANLGADDPFRPFDERDELLAGPLWARQLTVAMTASGWDHKVTAALVRFATDGRASDPRSVLKTEASRVSAAHRRLDLGELALGSDGQLVDVTAGAGGGAAA